MSLSRIVKKPGNVIFNEIVQIKEQSNKITNQNVVFESQVDIDNQYILDAQLQAEQLLNETMNHINHLKQQFDEECKNTFNKIKEEAYILGYEEGKSLFKNEALLQLEAIGNELLKLEQDKNELLENELNKLQSRTYQIGLDVAKKILRYEIKQDQSILKNMILDEIDLRKNQNIHFVEISKKAESLIFDLKNELEMRGIHLQLSNDEMDHVVIESDSGQFDISIRTQIRNIERLFNTL